MHLVMFDIDGTLTETMRVDGECFVRSFMDVFGFSDIDTDWSHYRHTTDSGILHDVYASLTGRPSNPQDFVTGFTGLQRALFDQVFDDRTLTPRYWAAAFLSR